LRTHFFAINIGNLQSRHHMLPSDMTYHHPKRQIFRMRILIKNV